MLLGGRAADLIGPPPACSSPAPLTIGVSSLIGGFAASEGVLIGARLAQGPGGRHGRSPAAASSILTTTFKEGPDRNKALGIWGSVGRGSRPPRACSWADC